MTSLNPGESIKGEHSFVTVCASQAQIALIHLHRIWAREGEPPDLEVWRNVHDPLEVWADLQGALTAGIVLSRLLKPAGIRARGDLNQKQARANSNARGERLRALLDVREDSVLLTISDVRDPVEHIDERLDQAVEDNDIYSTSDLYIADIVYQADRLSEPTRASGPLHANMRTFLPMSGEVVYGAVRFDLFRYEAALLELLRAVPAARTTIDRDRPRSGQRSIGSSHPVMSDPALIRERRSGLANMRKARSAQGLRESRVVDPQSVVMVITPSSDGATGSNPDV
ncbi:hypothetical protein [Microbacterium sp. SSM24]|uniref:hypothetical protein n=1 Tax=Microbacterium sp. SSM24 TaxID=2991714 RepID=UPI002227C6FC|nr:hypothetical protein [Microbacterium sp. SSM24]MCW3494174.1 hypothetical protein [Microbacterium sp. SSM24]